MALAKQLELRPAPSTPDRILDAALALFNQQGAARITTVDIAASASMREGNLQYHFRKKEHLIEALFSRFQAEELLTAEQTIANPADATAYMQYTQGWFELMMKFRCFYRDATTLFAHAPQLRPLFAATQIRARAGVARVLTLAIEHNLMRATPHPNRAPSYQCLDRLQQLDGISRRQHNHQTPRPLRPRLGFCPNVRPLRTLHGNFIKIIRHRMILSYISSQGQPPLPHPTGDLYDQHRNRRAFWLRPHQAPG